jgi:hypothetical protein
VGIVASKTGAASSMDWKLSNSYRWPGLTMRPWLGPATVRADEGKDGTTPALPQSRRTSGRSVYHVRIGDHLKTSKSSSIMTQDIRAY